MKSISIFLASLFAAACDGGGQVSVDSYLATRDAHIKAIEEQGDAADDRSALAKLDAQLKTLIGPVKVDGFPETGKINLSTLHKEMGFGQLDGLRFDSDRESMVVTTQALLTSYLAERTRFPRNIEALAKNDEFYLRALTENAAVYHYAEVPIRLSGERSVAYAFLALVAQDTRPIPPEWIFVFLSNGDHIFVVMAEPQVNIDPIQSCQSDWDNSPEGQQEDAFIGCYARESKNQLFFPVIVNQAQAIVDRLQRAKVNVR